MTTNDSALRTTLTVLAALAAIPLVVMVVAMPTMGLLGGGHAAGGPGGWQMLFVPLFPLTVVGGVLYVLYTRTTDRNAPESTTRESRSAGALDELRAAYARGDLSTDEYETRREVLRDRNSAAGDVEVSSRD